MARRFLENDQFFALTKELVKLNKSYVDGIYKHMQYVEQYDKAIQKYGITKDEFISEAEIRLKEANLSHVISSKKVKKQKQ